LIKTPEYIYSVITPSNSIIKIINGGIDNSIGIGGTQHLIGIEEGGVYIRIRT